MTSQLTVSQRASIALAIDLTEEQLQELAAQTKDVTTIKDKTDYALVKGGQMALRDTRIKIEKAGKDARDDANKFSKAVLVEQRRLVGIISDEEERLKAMRKVVDDAEEARKRAEAEKEEARIADMQKRVAAIYGLAEGLLNATADGVRDRIVLATGIDVTSFQEFEPAALLAKSSILDGLNTALEAKMEQEEAAKLAAEVAAAQAEKQAELDRKEAEIAKKEAAIEAERLAAIEEKKAVLAEEIRKTAEANAAEQAQQAAELELLRQNEAKEAARIEAEKEAARQEKLRPEKERLQAWGQMIKDIDPPKNIRTKAGKEIVAAVLEELGNLGNAAIADAGKL